MRKKYGLFKVGTFVGQTVAFFHQPVVALSAAAPLVVHHRGEGHDAIPAEIARLGDKHVVLHHIPHRAPVGVSRAVEIHILAAEQCPHFGVAVFQPFDVALYLFHVSVDGIHHLPACSAFGRGVLHTFNHSSGYLPGIVANGGIVHKLKCQRQAEVGAPSLVLRRGVGGRLHVAAMAVVAVYMVHQGEKRQTAVVHIVADVETVEGFESVAAPAGLGLGIQAIVGGKGLPQLVEGGGGVLAVEFFQVILGGQHCHVMPLPPSGIGPVAHKLASANVAAFHRQVRAFHRGVAGIVHHLVFQTHTEHLVFVLVGFGSLSHGRRQKDCRCGTKCYK